MIRKAARQVVFLIRRLYHEFTNGRALELGRSVQFGRGVKVRVTDGGILRIGDQSYIGDHALLVVRGGELVIGSDTHASHGCTLVAQNSVRIGSRCLIGEYVTVRDQDHRPSGPGSVATGFEIAPIVIEDEVWLGAKVTVTRGTSIGSGAVVGANSLARGRLESGLRYGGVPVRPLT